MTVDLGQEKADIQRYVRTPSAIVEKTSAALQAPRHAPSSFTERRQEPRFQRDGVPAKILLEGDSESMPARVLDISTSGVRLGLSSPLATGSEVTVRFENTVATGQVRYCRCNYGRSFEVGLRLTDALNLV